MRYLMIVLALAGAAPAAAQQSTAPSAPVADPARFAAAQRIIDLVWPVGTFRQMMENSMKSAVDSSMESVLGMRVGDIAPAPEGGSSVDPMRGSGTWRRQPTRIFANATASRWT